VGDSVAFFSHEARDGGSRALTAVSLAREETRMRVRLRPVVLSGRPASFVFSDQRMVLSVDVPREGSGAAPTYAGDETGDTGALVIVGAADLAISGVTLDEVVDEVGVVGDHYYALHPDPMGDVTFVPKATPRRSAARRWDGFLLSGLLDREEGDR